MAPPDGKFATSRIGRVSAAKLAECWKQCDVLEAMLRGPFFCGARLSLADLAVYPTFVFFLARSASSAGPGTGGPSCARGTARWPRRTRPAGARRAAGTLHAKVASGILDEIIAETRDERFKWRYP